MTATATHRPGHRAGFFVALRFPLFKELPDAGTTDASQPDASQPNPNKPPPDTEPATTATAPAVRPTPGPGQPVALLSTTFQQFRRSAFAHQQARSRPSLPTIQPVALLSPTCRAFTDPKPLAFFAY
jgi:hypothetical protein